MSGVDGGCCGADAAVSKSEKMTVFRPPIIRSGAIALNRALFTKKVTIAAAAVKDNRNISKYRHELSSNKKILYTERISPIAPHPDQSLAAQGRKCILLDVNVKAEGKVG
jgi:tRNA (guanine37-N1)-methyltransferase